MRIFHTASTACAIAFLFNVALAQDAYTFVPRIEFACGGSKVTIDSAPKGFRSPEEAFASTGQVVRAQLVVVRGDARAVFEGWHDIDYIGGQCVTDSSGKPYIIYQAICGGSGCHDSNWGIIDAASLREVLKPEGENTARATGILGAPPPALRQFVNLLEPR